MAALPVHGRTGGVADMIRNLFVALFLLSLVGSLTLWFGGGPHLNVQQVEANLAR